MRDSDAKPARPMVVLTGERRSSPGFIKAGTVEELAFSFFQEAIGGNNDMGKKKRKQLYKPTESDREGAAGAFLYELKMFRFSVKLIELYRYPYSILSNYDIRNAALEAALLHARNLLDFFAGKNSPKDDIIAGYFIDEPLKLPYLENLRNDINKSLSHLTYARIGASEVLPLVQTKVLAL